MFRKSKQKALEWLSNFEGRLTELVRSYPQFYSSSRQDFKDAQTICNSWLEMADLFVGDVHLLAFCMWVCCNDNILRPLGLWHDTKQTIRRFLVYVNIFNFILSRCRLMYTLPLLSQQREATRLVLTKGMTRMSCALASRESQALDTKTEAD